MNIKGKNISNKNIIIIVVTIVVVIGGVIAISMNSSKINTSNNQSENTQQKENDTSEKTDGDNKAPENIVEEDDEPTVNITNENKNFTTEFIKPDKILINKGGEQLSLTAEENADKFNEVITIINKMFNDDMSLKETTITLDDMSNILTEQSAVQLMYADDQKGNFKINGGESGAEKTYNEVIIPLSGDSTNLVFLYGSEQATYSEALSEFKYGEELIKAME